MSTNELIRELEAIRRSAKPYPSGAHGQTLGQETWRITLSGNSLQSITDAADKLIERERQHDTLLAVLEQCRDMVGHADNVAFIDAAIAEVKGVEMTHEILGGGRD